MRAIDPIAITTAGVSPTLESTNVDDSADPAAYDAGATYAITQRCVVSETIFESRIDGNIGNNPPDSPDEWFTVGPINALAMFDHRVGSQTTNPNTIVVVLRPGRVVDTLSVLNFKGKSITLTQTDPVDGVVLGPTVIKTQEKVVGWWQWLYFPIVRNTATLYTKLRPYRNSTITVTIDNTGGTAACGGCILGQSLDAGPAQHGSSDGIEDYSVVTKDRFGIRDFQEGEYADDPDITVWVDQSMSARFKRFLISRRAKPTLFVLDDSRPDAQYYGLPSYRRVFQFHGLDVYSIKIKGL